MIKQWMNKEKISRNVKVLIRFLNLLNKRGSMTGEEWRSKRRVLTLTLMMTTYRIKKNLIDIKGVTTMIMKRNVLSKPVVTVGSTMMEI